MPTHEEILSEATHLAEREAAKTLLAYVPFGDPQIEFGGGTNVVIPARSKFGSLLGAKGLAQKGRSQYGRRVVWVMAVRYPSTPEAINRVAAKTFAECLVRHRIDADVETWEMS